MPKKLRSGFERTLDLQLKSAKVAYEYEDTKIPYTLDCVYNPDFHLLRSGIFIEAKGRLLPEDRRKHLAIKLIHPELDVRFVFMKADQKIFGMKTTHAQWADKHGFKWADGKIPQSWLEE